MRVQYWLSNRIKAQIDRCSRWPQAGVCSEPTGRPSLRTPGERVIIRTKKLYVSPLYV